MHQVDAIRIGTIKAHKNNRIFDVELDDGSTIKANVKPQTARTMFRIVAGDRVRVRLPAADNQHALILGHQHDEPIVDD